MSSAPIDKKPSLYGVMAEFDSADALMAAAHSARKAGYTKMDGYSPFPIEELDEALGFKKSWLPAFVLLGGLAGLALGYGLQYWISVINYPVMVGGRPYHSWPSFIPVTYELMILLSSRTATVSMFALNALPMSYHPVFNVKGLVMGASYRVLLLT